MVLTALSPAQSTAGSAGFTLQVTGLNFCRACTVTWNGASRPTTVVSPAKANVTISATDLAKAGKNSVLMLNTQNQKKSNVMWFTVAASPSSPSTTLSVVISPSATSLEAGKSQQFTATVSGTSNTSVSWVASGGAISSSGMYTAPSSPGSYVVTATSMADKSKSASAAVTVSAPVSITISPTSSSILTGSTQQFTATVSGSSNTAVNWSATAGGVSSTGLYTASSTAGTYTVTATSVADSTKSASATVTVSAPVAVSISPVSTSLLTGGTQQFTATVSGSSNTAVTWSATAGSVSSSGLYTAPGTAGSYTVKATSVADATKSASATVTASAPVAVSISPVSTSLLTGGTQQFTATVSGSTNTTVTWSATGGSISSGLYTAPGSAGTYTVKATSVADTTKSASATVTVSAAPVVSITISPTSSSILTGGTQQFTMTVSGSSNTAVTWSATAGSVSSSGLYTAPGTAGSYTVKATSAADTTKSASATVTVSAPVAVSISPVSASLLTGGTQQFTTTVTGASNTAVTWSVTGGSISSGLYTAPGSAGTYTVKATSVADTTKSASATVTVSAAPVVSITISPTSSSILTGGTQQFTTTVTGASNAAVTWSVTGGSISSGLYTAPGSAGTYTVTATSVADTTKSANATVSVSLPLPPPTQVPLLVQRSSGSNSWASQLTNAPTSYHAYLPDGTQPGNTIAVALRYYNNPAPSSITITDDKGNTYSAGTGCSTLDTTYNNVMVWYYASNVAAGTRAVTVTLAASGPVSYIGVHLFELANVGPLDGCSGGFATSTSVTAGPLMPSASGDMILQAVAKDNSDTQTTITAGLQPNINWQLATADLQDKAAMAVQWGVYGSTTAFTPTMSTGGATSNAYVTSAIAFTAASAGSDLPAGIHIRGILHNSVWSTFNGGPDFTTPVHVGLPAYGNLLVLAMNGAQHTGNVIATAVTDTNGNSTCSGGITSGCWLKSPSAVSSDPTGAHINEFWVCGGCVLSSNMVATVTFGGHNDYTVMAYDITGATWDGVLNWGGNTGNQSSFTNPLTTASVTPTTANGLVLCEMDNQNNTVTGMSGAGFIIDSEWYNNESLNGAENVDENNGWGHYYNPDTSPVSCKFTYNYTGVPQSQVTSTNQGYWASQALAIKAATVSTSTTGSITITPASAVVMPGATQQFTATVSGTTNTVTWSATAGTVSSNGLYTAPTTAGTYMVTATVGNVTNSATVTVGSPVQHTVTLTWTADASPVAGYNVYRSTVSGGPYTRINSALNAATNYVDNSVLSGQTYYYVTTAVNTAGAESAYSNQVTASVPSP